MDLSDLIFFFLLLIVSAGLGILAQRLLHLKIGGLLAATFLGLAGAYLGREVAYWLHLPTFRLVLTIGDRSFPVVWAVIGALVTTIIVAGIAKSASKQKKT